jgi:hypothetical protein
MSTPELRNGTESAFGANYDVRRILRKQLYPKALVTSRIRTDVICAVSSVDLGNEGLWFLNAPSGLLASCSISGSDRSRARSSAEALSLLRRFLAHQTGRTPGRFSLTN